MLELIKNTYKIFKNKLLYNILYYTIILSPAIIFSLLFNVSFFYLAAIQLLIYAILLLEEIWRDVNYKR